MKRIFKPDKFTRKRILSASLAAAAGLTLAAGHARAVEPVVSASQGDLILGFQESGDNDLEVDLGPISNFLNATSIEQISFGVIPTGQAGAGATVTSLNADLTANYGSSWNSSNLIDWGLVAASGNNNFLSIDSANPNIPQRPPVGGNTTGSDIASLIDTLGGSPSTTNSSKTASIVVSLSSPITDSWSLYSPGSAAFDTSYNIEQLPGADTATTSTLNLWELIPNGRNGGGNATDIGSFSLNPSGNLTYIPAAVPEPSTWLSFLGGAVFLGLFRLRRQRRLS